MPLDVVKFRLPKRCVCHVKKYAPALQEVSEHAAKKFYTIYVPIGRALMLILSFQFC